MLGTDSPLARHLHYPKFAGPACTVVFFDTPYPTVAECGRGLEKLGHTVFSIPLGNDFIKRLLSLLVEVKPDFLLTVNHLGFDEKGALTNLLTTLRMPFASWYVDSPKYVMKDRANVSPYCSVFCWEKGYLKYLADMGFEEPLFLPLATDPEIFRPASATGKGFSGVLSFVGGSVQENRDKWERKIPFDLRFGLTRKYSGEMHKKQRKSIFQLLENTKYDGMSPETAIDAEALLVWKATQDYRKHLLSCLLPLGLVIYGDRGWKKLLPGCKAVRPAVSYFKELPDVYRGSRINLNATSFQMPTAVNQRVFDVPACGGFLLTDRQEDMDLFFNPGTEAVCYDTPEEAVDLAAYYLRKDSERMKIARAAHKRVMAGHTYETRMSLLVDTVRKKYS